MMKRIVLLLFIVQYFSCGSSKIKTPISTDSWLKNANLYELIPGIFSSSKNFSGISNSILHFQKMFVNAVALSPIQPLSKLSDSFNPGNVYAVSDYYQIEPSLGTEHDLNNLIDSFHAAKIKVFLEFNIAMTAENHSWRSVHTDYYMSNEKEKEGKYNPEFIHLNLNNTKLQQEFYKIFDHWINKFPIDGFLLYGCEQANSEFMNSIIERISTKQHAFVIVDNPLIKVSNQSIKYGKLRTDLYAAFEQAVKDSLHTDFFVSYFNKIKADSNAIDINFSHNFYKDFYDASLTNKFYNNYKTFAAFCNVFPGISMMFNGQEEPMFTKLNTMQMESLQFKYFYSQTMYRTYNIHKWDNPALKTECRNIEFVSDSKDILAFERSCNGKSIVFIANLTDRQTEFTLTKDFKNYTELFTRAIVQFKTNTPFSFGPYQYVVLTNVTK